MRGPGQNFSARRSAAGLNFTEAATGEREGLVCSSFDLADPHGGVADLGGAAEAVDGLCGVDDDAPGADDVGGLLDVIFSGGEDFHRVDFEASRLKCVA